MVVDIMKAGGLVVAGTDTPNGINLHGELIAYTMAGMTPYDALEAATVNPARRSASNAGTIEAGKLADLVMVDGDPLADIANTTKVRRVIANGRVYELEELLSGKIQARDADRRALKPQSAGAARYGSREWPALARSPGTATRSAAGVKVDASRRRPTSRRRTKAALPAREPRKPSGLAQRRHTRRRPPMVRRLLVRVGELDQRRLGPRAAEERHARRAACRRACSPSAP